MSPYLKSINRPRDRGDRGREIQNCRLFWTRLGSSRLKVINNHNDRGGGVVAKPRIVVILGFVSRLRISKVSTVPEIGEIVVAKSRIVVFFGLASGLRVSKLSIIIMIGGGGRGRETQNCSHSWTRLASPYLKSINNYRDRGGRGRETAKPRIVVTFGLALGLRV